MLVQFFIKQQAASFGAVPTILIARLLAGALYDENNHHVSSRTRCSDDCAYVFVLYFYSPSGVEK